MKYEVEIPDGKFCNERKPCPFLVNSEHGYCQLNGDRLNVHGEAGSKFRKSIRCPALTVVSP